MNRKDNFSSNGKRGYDENYGPGAYKKIFDFFISLFQLPFMTIFISKSVFSLFLEKEGNPAMVEIVRTLNGKSMMDLTIVLAIKSLAENVVIM
jgi:hypothetical protein